MDKRVSAKEEYDNLVGLVRMMSKIISIWPIGQGDVGDDNMIELQKAKMWQRCHGIFIMIFMTGMAFAQMADAYRHRDNIEEFTKCCLVVSSCILTVVRTFFYTRQSKNMEILVEWMRDDWVSASEEDKAILRKKCAPAFRMTKYFTTCISSTIAIALVYPTFQILVMRSEERVLPYGGYFVVDSSKSPIYQLLYAVEVVAGIYGVFNVVAVNCFNLISIIHGAAKFLILQSHISGLKSDDERCNVLLRSYIQEHQDAIRFADILEEVINKVAFGQFIISTGLVCFAGLQISEVDTKNNVIHLIMYGVYLTSAIFELFLFSYSGYQLTLESGLVGDAAYNSDWIGSSFTQDLNIVMMRSTKPNRITAAKFYDMSLESFTAVLSTSFSYFTTLRAMNEE